MKIYKALIIMIFTFMITGLSFTASSGSSPGDSSEDTGWPRVFEKNGKVLTVYQPQVDYWKDYKELGFRCAISLKTGKSKKEKFGILDIEADTVTDQSERVVALISKKREIRFPNTSESESASLVGIVNELHPPTNAITISLDRILAYIDSQNQTQQHPVEVSLDPPKIFYSSKPAILVLFMGKPELKPVEKDRTDLMFAVNTNWDVFYDTADQNYYLLNGSSWLKSGDPSSEKWDAVDKLPPGLSSLPANDNWADVQKNIPGKFDKNPPLVFVSNEPAELILTNGETSFSPIKGTKLLHVENSESVVFLNSGDGKYYILMAGRWFRAGSLEGPWSSASKDLPADFARIPDDDPSAFVKSSVPGTTDAKDAVLLASIPSTSVVKKSEPVKVDITYSGEPKFQTIPDTKVQYATNSPNTVFIVNGSYYCCENGVWLNSSSANGPWAYCTNVPKEIYSIPPTHPTHNVTYVVVQDSTPDTVTYSQTSGYSGEYVAATGVLMFGAGMILGAMIADDHDHYYYPPYPAYYSYGCGARYSYAYGGYYRAAQVSYGPYGGAGAAAKYNPYTGTYSRGAYAYGPAGSASVRQAYNPYTGARATSTRVNTAYGSAGRGAAYNPSTGTAVRGGYRSNANGSAAGFQTNKGTGAVAWDTKNSEGAVAKGRQGNVYAGKDGTVYKKDNSGSWSSNSGDGWESVDRPQPKKANSTSTSAQSRAKSSATQLNSAQTQSRQVSDTSANRKSLESRQSLESQAQARQRGNQLSQRSRMERPSGGSFGGGGRRSR